jgi:hypothetical protein
MKHSILGLCIVCAAAVLAPARAALAKDATRMTVHAIVGRKDPARQGKPPVIPPALRRFAKELAGQGFDAYEAAGTQTKPLPADGGLSFGVKGGYTLEVRRKGARQYVLRVRGGGRQLLHTDVTLSRENVLVLGAWPVQGGSLILIVQPR